MTHSFKQVTCFLIIAAASMLTACNNSAMGVGNITPGYAFARPKIKLSPTEAVSTGHWDKPAGLEGEHLIVIDTNLQIAKYYIANRQVGWSAISSGKAGHGTPSGTFPVLEKDIDHTSSTYGSIIDANGNTLIADYKSGDPIPAGGSYKGAPMNFGMRLTNDGIWMHEGIVTSAPESHGCIRLPREMARLFYENTPVGTNVIIK